ncbi:biosynthetic peptidoglycan transglycosylase [Acidisoma silvae]|uniref:Transglycosylase domain-containing protein n=1 Tax=Acidisoma silvae TaxID=2802396 RepID=A0A964DZG1_9PROT|nr:biosynthetic peptidoglycan transglycosylase [Acidisoma silvae]MCB8876059.1 transglycosylase domain-containing protein [Acidisoma silvae]
MRQTYSRKSQFQTERRRLPRVVLPLAIIAVAAGLAAFSMANSTPAVTDAPQIARAFATRHHEAFPAPRPPAQFVDALVATEDQRFFWITDMGVDPIALTRLVLGVTGFGPPGGGGASIDQQLAKMLYTPNQSGSFLVDVEQVILAFKLHLSYSHAAILGMYAEMAYFGNGYYGLEAAGQGYFGATADALTAHQAAMLAGLVNAPSADNPRTHLARATARCRHVFGRLVALHYLTENQAKAQRATPLGLITSPSP